MTADVIEATSHSSSIQLIERAILAVVLADLALGGNGYLFTIGPMRLRTVLFAICVPWAIVRLVTGVRIDARIFGFLAAFAGFVAITAVIGYRAGNPPSEIIAELKPLGYFPMILFFAVAIRDEADVALAIRVLAFGAGIVGVIYLAILLAAWSGLVPFVAIHDLLHTSDEFLFRLVAPEHYEFVGFFYKGFFYLGIGALLLAFDQSRHARTLCIVAVTALALSMTRSLALGFALGTGAGMVLSRQYRLPLAAVAVLSAVLAAGLYAEGVINQKALVEFGKKYDVTKAPTLLPHNFVMRHTDEERLTDVQFVLHHIDLRTVFFGQGLGAPINGRPRIELNYLDMLYKQGLAALAFWAALFFYVLWLYRRASRGAVFVAIAVFVYATNAFNAFLPGSFGMSAMFIAIASLTALEKKSRAP